MADGFTIGEVLNQLKQDFEDITISKIRFLESEGLVSPDRTDSGYRKFSEDDVDRLRFILTAQRDHYLPLKVIREQLQRLDAGEAPSRGPQPGGPGPEPAEDRGDRRADDIAAALRAAVAGGDSVLAERGPAVALSLKELCEATELDAAEVRSLRDFGILGAREGDTFDGEDLIAARAARELLALGLEPRHLRMYRQFVEREVALFEQLVAPLLRQRNPEARRQAAERLDTVANLTGRVQRSLLARALRAYVQGA